MVNGRRPRSDVTQPTAALVRATGKCAECHRRETSAVVHEFEMSRHSATGVNCLECHRTSRARSRSNTAGSRSPRRDGGQLQAVPPDRVRQYLRSRTPPRAWASVAGRGRLHQGAGRVLRAVPQGGRQSQGDGDRGSRRHPSPSRTGVRSATTSASRTRTARSALARRATRDTPLRSSSPGPPRPAASATWGLTTRRSRSTTSRSTASCSTPRRPS